MPIAEPSTGLSLAQTISWGVVGYRLKLLSLPNSIFNVPGGCSYHACWGKDGLLGVVWGVWGELAKKCIRLSILKAGAVSEGEIEPAKEEGPTCLTGFQSSSCPEVGKILVV